MTEAEAVGHIAVICLCGGIALATGGMVGVAAVSIAVLWVITH